uniref:Uncharacterized protein n=1 Tax=Myoviridae sp. ctbwh6 TaxID=2827611 RepID=A0A8S5LHK5_9CAUD|nr:MAG TPA: hypothetical protein [Myoviridae sp. ctbwh6]
MISYAETAYILPRLEGGYIGYIGYGTVRYGKVRLQWIFHGFSGGISYGISEDIPRKRFIQPE